MKRPFTKYKIMATGFLVQTGSDVFVVPVVGSGSGGNSGGDGDTPSEHNNLDGRDLPESHPAVAISTEDGSDVQATLDKLGIRQSVWYATTDGLTGSNLYLATIEGNGAGFNKTVGVIVVVRRVGSAGPVEPDTITLKVGDTPASLIRVEGAKVPSGSYFGDSYTWIFQFDGTYWNWLDYPLRAIGGATLTDGAASSTLVTAGVLGRVSGILNSFRSNLKQLFSYFDSSGNANNANDVTAFTNTVTAITTAPATASRTGSSHINTLYGYALNAYNKLVEATTTTLGLVRYPTTASTGTLFQSVIPYNYTGTSTTVDLNTYCTVGTWVWYNPSSSSTNFPDGWTLGSAAGACILTVAPFYSNTIVRQLLHKRGTNEMWIRYSTSASAWGAWEKLATTNDTVANATLAASATKLATARTITVTPTSTTAGSFDGSGDIAVGVTVTVAADAATETLPTTSAQALTTWLRALRANVLWLLTNYKWRDGITRIYVSTTGNDNNDGLSSSNPVATIDGVNKVASRLRINGELWIQFAAGTYAGGTFGALQNSCTKGVGIVADGSAEVTFSSTITINGTQRLAWYGINSNGGKLHCNAGMIIASGATVWAYGLFIHGVTGANYALQVSNMSYLLIYTSVNFTNVQGTIAGLVAAYSGSTVVFSTSPMPFTMPSGSVTCTTGLFVGQEGALFYFPVNITANSTNISGKRFSLVTGARIVGVSAAQANAWNGIPSTSNGTVDNSQVIGLTINS